MLTIQKFTGVPLACQSVIWEGDSPVLFTCFATPLNKATETQQRASIPQEQGPNQLRAKLGSSHRTLPIESPLLACARTLVFLSRGSRHPRLVRSLIANREVQSATSVLPCARHHHRRQVLRASFWLAHNPPPGDSRGRPFVLLMSGLGLLVRVLACLCRRLPVDDCSHAFRSPSRGNTSTRAGQLSSSAPVILCVYFRPVSADQPLLR